MRFLVKEVEALRETAERVKGLERENREMSKQAAIDQRTVVNLREVSPKEQSPLSSEERHLLEFVVTCSVPPSGAR